MSYRISTVELTRKLIAFDTMNPPGRERALAHFIGDMLSGAGWAVSHYEFEPGRTSLVARLKGAAYGPALCFSGHLDTVPLGAAPWRVDPFAGVVEGDRLYGRGASDMKGGLAAVIDAALRLSKEGPPAADILIVFSAGEEKGCEGARYLAGLDGVLDGVGALIVCEPTANYPMLGHKGAAWLEAETAGRAAHGSMPDEGENAIYAMADAIVRLRSHRFSAAPHPVLGGSTLNVGLIAGGTAVNIVPDRCVIHIDVRLTPLQALDDALVELTAAVGPAARLRLVSGAEGVWTDPAHPWVDKVFNIMTPLMEAPPAPRGVTYFTDASALSEAMGAPPALILGPGEPDQAHKTDEYCRISRLETAADAYFRIASAWGGESD